MPLANHQEIAMLRSRQFYHSTGRQIGSPKSKKMPIKIKRESNDKSDSPDLVKNQTKKQIFLKIKKGIGR